MQREREGRERARERERDTLWKQDLLNTIVQEDVHELDGLLGTASDGCFYPTVLSNSWVSNAPPKQRYV